MAKTAVSTEVRESSASLFDKIGKDQLPAMVDDDIGSNIENRQTAPSLSYEGKVWTVILNGEKTRLMRKDEDGDPAPVQVFKGVIVDYAKRRGRAYYEGTYDPAKPGRPKCWSDDGITPHKAVEEPQSDKCESCPYSAKGSRVSEQGKATTACSQHRMLVVVPSTKLDFQPLRMKLAITSDWDSASPEMEQQGWRAFQQYLDHARAKGLSHSGRVVTKMKFDPGVAFPKVLFAGDRFLTEEEWAKVKTIIKDPNVQSLLNGSWTPDGGAGTKTDSDTLPAPKAKKIAKPAPVEDEEEEEDAPAPAPKAKKVSKPAPVEDEEEEEAPAPKPKKKAAPVAEEDDEGDVILPPKGSAKKARPAAEDAEDANFEEIAVRPAKAAKKAPPPDEEEEEDVPEFLDRRSPAIKAAAKKAAPPVEDEEEEEAPAPKPKKKAAPVAEEEEDEAPAPKKGKSKEAELDAILGDWGQD